VIHKYDILPKSGFYAELRAILDEEKFIITYLGFMWWTVGATEEEMDFLVLRAGHMFNIYKDAIKK